MLRVGNHSLQILKYKPFQNHGPDNNVLVNQRMTVLTLYVARDICGQPLTRHSLKIIKSFYQEII